MKRSAFLLISAAAVLAGLNGAHAVLEVPYQYPTIGEACQVAVAGDTVAVYPGTYNEGEILVRPGVAVLGMGSDSTDVQVVAPRLLETFYACEGTAPVILENMELRGQESLLVISSNDSLRIHRCYLRSLPVEPIQGVAIALTWHGNVEIRRCHLEFGPLAFDDQCTAPDSVRALGARCPGV